MLPRKFYIDDVWNSLMESENDKMQCDIYEKDNNYVVEMDLPGYKKDEIKIECNKGNLIVNCEKESTTNEENKKYIRRERSYGKYSRSFYLGDIEEDAINATFTDGILTITIPKQDENKNKKYINID